MRAAAMNAREKFSPLTPEEIAAAPAITKPVRDDGEIVAPVPFDAPPLGVKFHGRKPDEVFWFVNENGEHLFAECRRNLEGGAKEVRPACFTDRGWKLVAYRAPRPIYNLDKLGDSPDRPVWLFEGPQGRESRGVHSERRNDCQRRRRERDQAD
jgi:hypothetical protein